MRENSMMRIMTSKPNERLCRIFLEKIVEKYSTIFPQKSQINFVGFWRNSCHESETCKAQFTALKPKKNANLFHFQCSLLVKLCSAWITSWCANWNYWMCQHHFVVETHDVHWGRWTTFVFPVRNKNIFDRPMYVIGFNKMTLISKCTHPIIVLVCASWKCSQIW